MLVAERKHSVDYKLVDGTKVANFPFFSQTNMQQVFLTDVSLRSTKDIKIANKLMHFVPLVANGVAPDGCYYHEI